MPSMALPTSVSTTAAAQAVAAANPAAAALGAPAGVSADGGAGSGDSAFAQLLGQQLSATGAAQTENDNSLICGHFSKDLDTPAETAAPDLATLLQGLMLPQATAPGTAEPASTEQPALEAQATPSGEAPIDALGALTQSATATATPAQPSPAAALAQRAGEDRAPRADIGAARDALTAGLPASLADQAAKAAASAARELPAADPLPVPNAAAQGEFAQALAQQLHTQTAHTHVAREAATVPTPVGTPGWDADVANKVSLMVGKESSTAELVLTPAHLGRVEVQITVNGDQTSAHFVAESQAARDALAQSLPQLRELLAGSGITLSQASVGSESQRDAQGAPHGQRQGNARGGESGVTQITTAPPARSAARGLVDTFA